MNMENILNKRKLLFIDKPLNKIDTFWRPIDWNSNIEIDGFLVDIKDIFFKYKFIDFERFPKEWFFYFEWGENTTLESLSLKQYGTMEYWWIIPLINNKLNPFFDFPLRTNELARLCEQILKEKNSNNQYKYKSYIIQNIKNDLLNALLEQYGYNLTEIELNNEYDTILSNYFDLFYGLLHEILETNNDKKRSILILKPEYINQFINGVKKDITQDFKIENFSHYKQKV